jgi:YHS domain-containing protein
MLVETLPRRRLTLALLALLACHTPTALAEFPTPAQAGNAVPWHHDIATARAASSVSGRPTLVIFTAPWNEPCNRFDAAVGRSIEATTLLGACFEPVRVNVSEDPWTTRRMGVSNVPAACIVDDRETVIVRFECPQTSEGFVTALCKASRDAALAGVDRNVAQASAAAPANPTGPEAAADGSTGATATPVSTELVGLEGFCPVCLVTRQAWVEGNPKITEMHNGQTYCFAGEAERRAFSANPEWYAPALGGDDAVLAARQGVIVAGRRAYSAAYKSRLYLFASPDTRDAFAANPDQFIRRAQIARGNTPGGRVVR